MGPEEAEALQQRRRRTFYLMGAGAVSLLLPLAGVAYLNMMRSPEAGPSGSAEGVFDRRDSEAARYVKAAEVPSPVFSARAPKPSASGQQAGSLGFINAGQDYRQETASSPPAAAAPPPVKEEPVQAEKEEPAADKKQANYPRLKKIESGAFVPTGFSEKKLGRGSTP